MHCRLQYGTSRPTIRRAIGLLVEKSLVIRQPGIGSIVASQPRSNKERKLKIGIDWNPSESFHNTAFYSDKLLSGILAAAEPHGHTVKFLPRTHRELYAKELDGIILTSILPTSEEESSYVTLAKQEFRWSCSTVFRFQRNFPIFLWITTRKPTG